MPETPQQSLLRRMFGNVPTGTNQVTKEPGFLRRFYNDPIDTLFNPEPSAFLTRAFGGRMHDIELPNESVPQQPFNPLRNMIDLRNTSPQNQLTSQQKFQGMARLRQRGID